MPTSADARAPRLVIPGVAAGIPAAVLEILGANAGPVRRRPLLAELERRGHRISLAGLNRVLQQLRERGETLEAADGVRRAPVATK